MDDPRNPIMQGSGETANEPPGERCATAKNEEPGMLRGQAGVVKSGDQMSDAA